MEDEVLIPVFGSCPTYLNKHQDTVQRHILLELGHAGLEWRSIGQTDYPDKFPLREVHILAKHCSGGVILGFSQFETKTGVWKRGTPYTRRQNKILKFPTAWNQLEGGILFALGLPFLVFREYGVSGGIFDNGVTDLFIHQIPNSKLTRENRTEVREVIRKWAHKVHAHYYRE